MRGPRVSGGHLPLVALGFFSFASNRLVLAGAGASVPEQPRLISGTSKPKHTTAASSGGRFWGNQVNRLAH